MIFNRRSVTVDNVLDYTCEVGSLLMVMSRAGLNTRQFEHVVDKTKGASSVGEGFHDSAVDLRKTLPFPPLKVPKTSHRRQRLAQFRETLAT